MLKRSLGCELYSVHIAVVLVAGENDGYMYQVVVENLWLDSTKKVPSIVAAFCVGILINQKSRISNLENEVK
jgi:hypothetical protein